MEAILALVNAALAQFAEGAILGASAYLVSRRAKT